MWWAVCFSCRPKRKSDEVNGNEATNGDAEVNAEEADVEEVDNSVLYSAAVLKICFLLIV